MKTTLIMSLLNIENEYGNSAAPVVFGLVVGFFLIRKMQKNEGKQ